MLRSGSFTAVALVALLAPGAARAICPTGFVELASASRSLGCIQQTEHGNGVPFPNYFQAAEICFDQYGGRLPTLQELVIAGENVTLGDQNQDEAEWVAGLVDPALDTGAGYTFFDGPSVRGPFSLDQVVRGERALLHPAAASVEGVGRSRRLVAGRARGRPLARGAPTVARASEPVDGPEERAAHAQLERAAVQL
jgi:hypothetical protein